MWIDGKYMTDTEIQAYVNGLKAQIAKWDKLYGEALDAASELGYDVSKIQEMIRNDARNN